MRHFLKNKLRPRILALTAGFAGTLSLAAGCQNPVVSVPSPGAATRAAIAPLSIQDPCANRLHDLGGLLLLYAAVHQQLPPTLEALRPYVDAGQTLQVTCPVSGRPYVYPPLGLTAPGDSRRIILYDAAPHQGYREALMLTPDADNKAPIFDVILVTDDVLRAFKAPEFK